MDFRRAPIVLCYHEKHTQGFHAFSGFAPIIGCGVPRVANSCWYSHWEKMFNSTVVSPDPVAELFDCVLLYLVSL